MSGDDQPTSSGLTSPSPPSRLRVAIISAGPSGFYAATQLLAVDEPIIDDDLFDLESPSGTQTRCTDC